MAVEVVAGSVVPHGRPRVGVPGGDLNISEVDSGVEHGGDEGVPQHVRVDLRHPNESGQAELPEASGCGVPVHPAAAPATEQRSVLSAVDGAVNGAGDRRWQRHEDHLAALAANSQHPVAVLLAEVLHVGASRFEDPKAQEPQEAHQGEVIRVRLFWRDLTLPVG